MSTALLERPNPLVLIVEDRPESLRRRVELFESFGCAALGASSREHALRELRSTPLVDLLVTDINMGEEGRPDKSGVELAQTVREMWSDIPIAGYSAFFTEEELSDTELGMFDLSFPKGGQRTAELADQVEQCVALAHQHRAARADEREEELQRLRLQHAVEVPPVEVLRRFEPDGAANISIEAPLLRAGYRLKLVSTSVVGSPREPFAVWLVSGDAGWESEVYGFPELYAMGTTEEESIERLVELMALFHEELAQSTELHPNVARLAEYLERTLGSR